MKGKLRLAFCSLVITALLLGASPALAVPVMPHAFYGTVSIDGADADAGTVVSAKVGGVDCGSYTVKVDGQYGNLDERDYLIVQGDISDGDTVTFHVRGILTDTDTFSAGGGPSEKNLVMVITDESITGEVEKTISAGQTSYEVDASDIADTTITVSTTGVVTITVKKYYSDPHPGATPPADTDMLPRYIDIDVDNPDAIAWPMYVEQSYSQDEVDAAGLDESSLGMCYFTVEPVPDGAWHRCSNTDVDMVANYIWAYIERDELPGCPVAIGGAVAVEPEPEPEPTPGGGGGAAPVIAPPPGTTDVRGDVSAAGRFWSPVTAISEDELCTLTIPAGTVGLTEELGPIDEISMLILDEPPPAPEDAHIIGLAYDFGPSGATFDPAITLTFNYDPADIPEGVAEEDLVIAYYDEAAGEWVELEGCVVDTENNTITAPLSHFTTFTIIGAVPPPPLAPAAFSVTNLSVKPAAVEPKEAVTISLSVANTGGTEGSYSVVLMINGEKEAEKSVTVAAGSSEDVSFTVTREEAASYNVVVDELSASFTVLTLVTVVPPKKEGELVPEEIPAKEINWPAIGAIIAVVVVGLVIFLVRRRRAV